MKTLKLIPILLCVFMLNVASMCSNDDNNSNPPADPTPVINTVNQGTWRITLYNDSGTIKTSNFTGYNFTFGSGNALTATNGSNAYNGTWSVTSGDSNDDNPSNDLDFNIGFTTPANFADLTDDWDIVTYTASKIELRDVSGGNGGTDLLTFEKN
ncbi:hypothetical protein [Flavobacterium sp.]|uniref:hypothetical protein n=1 Tax=Flavobacterium sp. TaxID=239 RepID=UPI00260AA9D1|nr:hypothetical protein [Flavobacterium sp.]